MFNPKSVVHWLISMLTLTCVTACNPRSREEEFKATEKVLRELGVDTDSSNTSVPPSNPTEINSNVSTPPHTDEKAESPKNIPSGDLQPTFTVDEPNQPWIAADQLPQEIWEVQYVGNTPVGYMKRTTEVSKSQGDKVFRIEADSKIRISIQGKSFEQRLRLLSIESDNGEVINLEGELTVGDTKKTFQGNVSKNNLRIIGTNNGQAYGTNLEWRPEYRGPFAIYQSLIRKPLKPFETRTLNYFDPMLGTLVEGKLIAEDYIVTPTMLDGSKELLEVRNSGVAGATHMNGLMWVDAKGVGYKSYMQSVDVRSFRTDPNSAQIVADLLELKNLSIREVPLSGSVESLIDPNSSVTSVDFRVSHRIEDPYKFISDSGNQRIRSVDPRTVDVSVNQEQAVSNVIDELLFDQKNEEGTISPSTFIPSKDSIVQKLAKSLLDADTELEQSTASNTAKANACRQGIFKRVRLVSFDNQIAPIPQIMRDKKADCVEHAILLTSVCRALGIPARIALGLIFNRSQTQPEMKFHAWTEIKDGAKWIAIDSADPSSPATLDRIKILESDLSSPSPYAEIVKVVRLIPDLEIKLLSK